MNVMVVVGTRPEAIKMAPVVHALKARTAGRTMLCATGQHREMLDSVFEVFDLKPDVDLAVMKSGQHLSELTARVLTGMRGALRDFQPDAVLVHGDTTSCLAAGLAAFYERIPVGHVEAGLRTYDLQAPWPEEMNRRLVDPLCRWCFAPTEGARQNLSNEAIPEDRIFVTGNTVVDALRFAAAKVRDHPPEEIRALAAEIGDRRLVLVTAHRRENLDHGFEDLCLGLRDAAEQNEDTVFMYPVHLNPRVRAFVMSLLNDHPRVRLMEPMAYLSFVWLMQRSVLILTDSGGIQEEAPSLNKPVLVMRNTTERPEVVRAGGAKLVGTDRVRIAEETTRLLQDAAAYRAMADAPNPFGDGQASVRIVDILQGLA